MKNKDKTKEQLIKELKGLRHQIAELKREGIALKEKQQMEWKEMYKALVETSSEAVTLTDLNGIITEVSQKTLKLHGYTNVEELLGKSALKLIAQEDHKRAMKNLQKTLKQGFVKNLEYTFLKKDGTRFSAKLNALLIKDAYGKPKAFIATTKDITKQKEAEKAIHKSEEHFRWLVEQSLQGFAIAQGNPPVIVFANTALAKMIGYALDELLSFTPQQVRNLIFPDDQKQFFKRYQERMQGKPVPPHFEFRAVRKDGTVRWAELLARRIEFKNKPAIQAVFIDITERKQVEETLKAFRSLQSNIPVGLFRTTPDPGGHLLSANPALAKMFGYESSLEMKDIRVADLYLKAEERKKFIKTISKAGEIAGYEVQLKRKDGSSFWGSLNARAITDKSGKLSYFDGILEDITERKRAENLQTSIYKISEAAHSTKNLDEFYRSIHSIISELMPAKNFYIALYNEESKTITFEYYVDEKDKNTRDKTSRKLSKGLTEYVLRKGKPLLVTAEKFKQLLNSGEIESFGPKPIDWLGIPLTTKGNIIGVLAVQSYTQGIRYTEIDMNILKFVSTQVAMAIERKVAEKALISSEEKYRGVVNNSLIALYITQSHILKFCNKQFAEMFGYEKPEHLIGKHVREFVAEESWKLVDRQVKLRESGKKKSAQYEFKGIRKDGTIFDIETAGIRIIFEGKPAIQGSMIDITERKKAEEELRKLATMDVLTEVFNRGYGLLLFGKELKTSKRNRAKLSICYVDVDGLKDVNDTYGHLEGDQALKLISQFFKDALREVDIICRMGGDEFLLIFPQCPVRKAETIWERIAAKVETFNIKRFKPYTISLSRGFAEFDPSNPRSVDQLIARADYEMYKDKQSKS